MARTLHWQLVPFDQLTPRQLYAALQLRTDVFALEQNCVFQDMDGCDHEALHLMGTTEPVPNAPLLAYARMFAPGIKYAEASVGRVVTRASERGQGLGHALMQEATRALFAAWGPQPIRIGAQERLMDFYAQHGFVVAGASYIEDGIAHIEMVRLPA